MSINLNAGARISVDGAYGLETLLHQLIGN